MKLEKLEILAKRYTQFLAKYPLAVIVLVVIAVVSMCIPLFKFTELPDGDSPGKGFRARGTDIRARQLALTLLGQRLQNKTAKCSPYCKKPTLNVDDLARVAAEKIPADLCFEFMAPGRPETLIAFAAKNKHRDLFTLGAIHEMCRIERELFENYSLLNFTECENTTYNVKGQFSLGSYIARMVNVPSCWELTDDLVEEARSELYKCREAYESGLLEECNGGKYVLIMYNSEVPKLAHAQFTKRAIQACLEATKKNCSFVAEAYAILNFMVDQHFLNHRKAQYALIHLRHTARDYKDAIIRFYKERVQTRDTNDDTFVEIFAHNLGVEYTLYLENSKQTLFLFVVAIGLVIVLMVIHLGSILVTFSTMCLVGFAFMITWFIYSICLGFFYFPDLNNMAGLLLIAVGADDVFVYYDIWIHEKKKRSKDPLWVQVYETLRHASASVFVTSFTTAAAFYSNSVSVITDIRLFGIFAGTSILINFILMITWIPAAILIADQMSHKCCVKKNTHSRQRKNESFINRLTKCSEKAVKMVFHKMLPTVVEKVWFVWIIIGLGFGVAGAIITFYKPGLQVPDGEYKFFVPKHPYEKYNLYVKNELAFSKQVKWYVPVYFVWGVIPEDTGKWFDPDVTTGVLQYDNNFNFFTNTSQTFFRNFCENLKNASFVNDDLRGYSQCYFDVIAQITSRPCDISPLPKPCCGKDFPLEENVFRHCLPYLYNERVIKTQIKNAPLMDFPIIMEDDAGYSRVMAHVVKIVSNFEFTFSFPKMNSFKNEIESFVKSEKRNVQAKYLQDGWYSSVFRHFDLQTSLLSGTYSSMLVSVFVAFGVMLLTSLNLLITIYAMLTIGTSILTTLGILVLLGWQLDIIESIFISVAIGLSIDFPIHYGVAYRLCTKVEPKERVRWAFKRVGFAVFMASLTTFLSGVAVIPAIPMSYRQLGTFLMIVMVISYLYATLFFQSLCRIIGPQGQCGQLQVLFQLCGGSQTKAAPDSVSATTISTIRERSPVPVKKKRKAVKPSALDNKQRECKPDKEHRSVRQVVQHRRSRSAPSKKTRERTNIRVLKTRSDSEEQVNNKDGKHPQHTAIENKPATHQPNATENNTIPIRSLDQGIYLRPKDLKKMHNQQNIGRNTKTGNKSDEDVEKIPVSKAKMACSLRIRNHSNNSVINQALHGVNKPHHRVNQRQKPKTAKTLSERWTTRK